MLRYSADVWMGGLHGSGSAFLQMGCLSKTSGKKPNFIRKISKNGFTVEINRNIFAPSVSAEDGSSVGMHPDKVVWAMLSKDIKCIRELADDSRCFRCSISMRCPNPTTHG